MGIHCDRRQKIIGDTSFVWPISWGNRLNRCHFQQPHGDGIPSWTKQTSHVVRCCMFLWSMETQKSRDNGHTFLWKGRFVGFVALKKNQPQVSSQHLRSLAVPRGRCETKKQQIHGACSLKKWWQAGWPRVVLGFPAVFLSSHRRSRRQPRSADQPRSHGPVTPLSFKSTAALIEFKGMDQYLLIPFLGGWTSIYQLFWCSPGVQVLTHRQIV